jgi:hypothetical protein
MNFIKSKIGKPISISDLFNTGLVDIHSVTKGYGTKVL